MPNSARWQAMLVMAFDGFGYALFKASQTFLIEQGVCREFHARTNPDVILPDGTVPESLCKTKELQSEVTYISGMFNMAILITGFLVSPVYTRLAPIIGKRTILLINSSSLALRLTSFFAVFYFHRVFTSINWILLSWVFDVVGGGIAVREILLWAYIAGDVSDDGLTGTFNLLSAMLIGMMSVGTFLGAVLLKFNVWVLCLVIIAVSVLNILPVILLPRDEKSTHTQPDEEGADEPLLASSTDSLIPKEGRRTTPISETLVRAITVDLYLSLKLLVEAVRDPFTRQVMAIFFTYTLAICVSGTTQQWASSTFGWKLADVDKITSMEQIISATALVLLPLLSQTVLRPLLRTKQRVDFQIIVFSLVISVVGALVMAVAPSMPVYAFGVGISALSIGLSDSLRSFATTAVKNSEAIEKLYMCIRTVQSLAGIVGTPLWADIFLLILKSDGALPPGLLFVGTATVFIVSLYLMRFVRAHIYDLGRDINE